MFSDIVDLVIGLDDDALMHRLREIEGLRREHAAEEAAVLAELERRRAYRADGHATMWGLLRSAVQWSDRECRERMRLAHLVTDCPDAGETLHEHQASVANIAEIARARANPRIGHELDAEMGAMLRLAERSEYDDLRRVVRGWELRTDSAHAHEHAQSAHERRNAHVHLGPDGAELAAQVGPLDAITIKEIFDHYVSAEWHADWDTTVAQHGDDASALLMPRTDAQRRADALRQIFVDAASRDPGAKAPEPVVNVHIDYHTFQDVLVEAELLPERNVDPFDDPLPHVTQRLHHTTNGDPIDPRTILQLLLAGYVRFVIRDDDGVPIRWGRTKRLFDGAARDAVRALSTRCTHPGCRVPTTRTDTDHTVDWSLGGATQPDNGNPRCRRHNLLKNRGYTVRRDAQGAWHTYRPDGTEVA